MKLVLVDGAWKPHLKFIFEIDKVQDFNFAIFKSIHYIKNLSILALRLIVWQWCMIKLQALLLGTVLSCSKYVRFEMYDYQQSKVQCFKTDIRLEIFERWIRRKGPVGGVVDPLPPRRWVRGRGQGLTLNDKNAKMHFSNSKRQMDETSGHAEIEYPIHFKNSRHFYAKLTS